MAKEIINEQEEKPVKKKKTPKKKDEEVLEVKTLDQIQAVVTKDDESGNETSSINENVSVEVPETEVKAKVKLDVVEETAKDLEIKEMPSKLSAQADGWCKWLAYQRFTPEDFLKKYPNHRMKHFINEIIEFNKQKN